MIQTHPGVTDEVQTISVPAFHLATILDQDRIVIDSKVSSKKRLLEGVTALLTHGSTLDTTRVFQILTERERLGSTGIGEGVAIPHGRIDGLDKPVGAFISLRKAINFDAQDQQAVNLVFGLLVPEEATSQHLAILAKLAGMFRDTALRRSLAAMNDANEVYNRLIHWDGTTGNT
ncbi:MAG TPA: PTS sugar transporter subunit IIA [Acidiferrobacteraceae bacterium]|nr:PTS sugar transporter subunit IIA [Acidiferrobacteraceae bacterium]